MRKIKTKLILFKFMPLSEDNLPLLDFSIYWHFVIIGVVHQHECHYRVNVK